MVIADGINNAGDYLLEPYDIKRLVFIKNSPSQGGELPKSKRGWRR